MGFLIPPCWRRYPSGPRHSAGAVCAINFIVAICMVDAKLGLRGAFPAAMLVGFGLYIAARGPGRFSVDSRLTAEREPHARVAVQS